MGRWTLKRVTSVSLACTFLLSSSAVAFADSEAAPAGGASSAPMTADSAPEAIKQFEKRLFLRNYGRDPLAARVVRIENHIFGQATEGDVQSRIAHLEQVLKQQLDHEKEQHELMGAPSRDGEPSAAGT